MKFRRFMEWVRENKVLSVKYRSSLYADSVTVQTTQPIAKKQPISVAEGRYNYAYVPWRFQKLVFSTQKKAKLKEIDSCRHFSPDEGILVKLVKERRNIFDSSRIEKVAVLYLCCSECKDEIGKRECDAVRKIGFTYQIWCNLDDLLLRKALDEAKITYEMGERVANMFLVKVTYPVFTNIICSLLDNMEY